MADDLKPKSHLALIGTIGTALISAYVAVTIAKVNAKTEIEKAGLDHKAVVERLNKLEEHAQQDTKDKAKEQSFAGRVRIPSRHQIGHDPATTTQDI